MIDAARTVDIADRIKALLSEFPVDIQAAAVATMAGLWLCDQEPAERDMYFCLLVRHISHMIDDLEKDE